MVFNSKDFADVQVECEGRVFDCHQVLLSARSPVFRAMLLADMAEAKAKKVCCFKIKLTFVTRRVLGDYQGHPIRRGG